MLPNLDPFIATYGVNAPRVRNDIFGLKQRFPNLVPVGDMLVTNGVASQVLKFTGTIPIAYKSNTYHIPLCIILPATYPAVEPSVFVTPTPDMAIKPQHQHVDQTGRCYLPSLANWRPQSSSLVFIVSELQGVFAVNPPVYARPRDAAVMPVVSASSPAVPQAVSRPPPVDNAVQEARKRVTDMVATECRHVGDEISSFMATQQALEAGAADVEDALRRMREHSRQLDAANVWTQRAIEDTSQWIEHQRTKAASGALAVPVDEIVVPTSAAGGQLLAAVATSKALEDAIYMLNKALGSDDVKLDCETFAKEMRKLCSAQFLQLALIRKIRQGR